MPFPKRSFDIVVVIAFVQTQVVRPVQRRSGSFNGNALERPSRKLEVVDVLPYRIDAEQPGAIDPIRYAEFRMEMHREDPSESLLQRSRFRRRRVVVNGNHYAAGTASDSSAQAVSTAAGWGSLVVTVHGVATL